MIGRKNFYGSGAEWAARLAADVWTVTATAARHDIEPLSLLTGYLEACAHTGGTAPAEQAWTPSCPGHRKDAPAVVPPAIPAPARNPGQSAARQSRTTPLRHMTPRVTPPYPADAITRSPTGSPITYVKVITSFRRWFAGAGPAGYPIPELRGILRRSQRALNLHFSHVLPPSAASAPHAHCRPLRHPFNLCPIVITSCQRSLAFGKVRDAKTRRSPDTIGSGKRRAFPSGQPRPIPVCCGAARLLFSYSRCPSSPARAVSSPARAGGLLIPEPRPAGNGG